MSFKCGFCKTTAPNGMKARMIPTEIRRVEYPSGSIGTETVMEERCCEQCWIKGVAVDPYIHGGGAVYTLTKDVTVDGDSLNKFLERGGKIENPGFRMFVNFRS